MVFLARLCYIFGGSEIYRLPYIHLLQNNSAPMDCNQNCIQMGYQCKNPFVCCLFIFIYIFVSRSFPLPSAFPSTDIERGKVFGLNTLRRRKIPTETACRPDLSTFKGYCTTFADEQRKGANDGIGKLIYRRLMIDQIKFYPAIMKSAPSFCSFIKKLYLCSKMSCTSMQITQVCRNQNSCQLITSFLNFPHKLFILSGL